MPALTATVSTTQEVKLAPKLRAKLMKDLRAYQALDLTLKETKAKMDALKASIEESREETGEQKVSLEGFAISLVAPIKKTFNPKLFVAEGGDLAIYNASFEDKPVKAYTKVTVPGAKDED